MEEWEVIFEPGVVVVVESMHGRDTVAGTVDLQVERYDFNGESLLGTCSNVDEVVALLRQIGVSEVKATEKAPELWAVMEDYLLKGPTNQR